MEPKQIIFEPITKGNTLIARTITFEIDNLDGTFSPINLTGSNIFITFRETPEGNLLKQLSIGNGIVLSNATAGQITMEEISPCEFPVGNIHFDIKVINADSLIITYAKGIQPILQNIG